MRKPKLSQTGIDSTVEGYRYVVVRPTGRTSRRTFGSPYRAAQYAMNAYRVETWTELQNRGYTIRGIPERQNGDL